MFKLTMPAVLCGALATIISAADIPNPKYEAALRRVDKKCGHLDASKVQLIRDATEKMHADGATRKATKKACKQLINEWPTDFKACSSAIVAVEYIPVMIPEPPPPLKISPKLVKALEKGAVELDKKLKDARNRDRKMERTGKPNDDVKALIAAKRNGRYLVSVQMRADSVGTLRVLRTITQIIDESNMIVSRGGRDATWIQDYETAGLTDGEYFQDFRTVFEYAGTKRYTTSTGSNTVHVLRPFPLTTDDITFLRSGVGASGKP